MNDGQQQAEKPVKAPGEGAANKLKEAFAKEQATKVEAQLKTTVTAFQVAKAEEKKLQDLLADVAEQKEDLNELIGNLV